MVFPKLRSVSTLLARPLQERRPSSRDVPVQIRPSSGVPTSRYRPPFQWGTLQYGHRTHGWDRVTRGRGDRTRGDDRAAWSGPVGRGRLPVGTARIRRSIRDTVGDSLTPEMRGWEGRLSAVPASTGRMSTDRSTGHRWTAQAPWNHSMERRRVPGRSGHGSQRAMRGRDGKSFGGPEDR